MSGGEADRMIALREQMIAVDERALSVGLHELEQLGPAGQHAITTYVVADYVGAHGVPVPAEWDAIVGRNASRPLALLLAATGVSLAQLDAWSGIDRSRLEQVISGGDDPSFFELGKILRAVRRIAYRPARSPT